MYVESLVKDTFDAPKEFLIQRVRYISFSLRHFSLKCGVTNLCGDRVGARGETAEGRRML